MSYVAPKGIPIRQPVVLHTALCLGARQTEVLADQVLLVFRDVG